MKKILFVSIYWIASTFGYGQLQTGLVREINSGKKPVGNVQVTFDGAVPTVSDDNGIFRLAFSGKRPGDFIFLNEIRKEGYELVNGKDLEVLKLSNADKLGEDIIIAKKGVIDAAKKEYYEISDKALLASFNREKTALQNKLKKAELGEKEYELQLTSLQEHFDRQQKSLGTLAERFARVNFDDIDSLYRTALELFKSGNIDSAIKKLEEADLPHRADDIIRAEGQLAKSKRDAILSIRLQADLYAMKFRFIDAEALFDKMLSLDSTSLDILQVAADFYREQHRYEKSLSVYFKIINHRLVDEWHIAKGTGYMSEIYLMTGKLSKSQDYVARSYHSFEKLLKQDTTAAYIKTNLAVSFTRIGETALAMGNLKTALENFKKSTEVIVKLCQSQPDELAYQLGLAITFAKTGLTYMQLGRFKDAVEAYEKSNQLFNTVAKIHPDNIDLNDGLGVSYIYLGEAYKATNDLNRALVCYEKGNDLLIKLIKAKPDNIEYKNNLSSSFERLGELYAELGNPLKALESYEKSKNITLQLSQTYPLNVELKGNLAVTYEKLGSIENSLGDTFKALEYYEDNMNLAKQLFEKNPDNVRFKNMLAISYTRNGKIQMILERKQQALEYFLESNRLIRELYEANMDNVEYKNGLTETCSKLSIAYYLIQDFNQAIAYAKENNKLCYELVEQFPENSIYKSNLAIELKRHGIIYFALGNSDSALGYLVKSTVLKEGLLLNKPIIINLDDLIQDIQVIIMQYAAMKRYATALEYATKCVHLMEENKLLFRNTEEWNKEIVKAYGNASYYALYALQFSLAEKYAIAGLQKNGSELLLQANLALAYLYQGKWEKVKEIYKRIKDQHNSSEFFKVVFLRDLKDLEAAGINHPDAAKIRAFLKAN